MKFNKRILQRSISKYSRISSYAGITPSIANQASLMFNAKYAEGLQDIEAGTLYFRDSNFNRVGATFSRSTTATRVNQSLFIDSCGCGATAESSPYTVEITVTEV